MIMTVSRTLVMLMVRDMAMIVGSAEGCGNNKNGRTDNGRNRMVAVAVAVLMVLVMVVERWWSSIVCATLVY